MTTVKHRLRLTRPTASASRASAGRKSMASWDVSAAGSQRVGQVDLRALVAAEAVARLVQLEADLEVRDRVGCHQQLVAVQARQQVPGHIVVPKGRDPAGAVALCLPPVSHRPVDEVDRLDQEGASARGGIEDLDEGLIG